MNPKQLTTIIGAIVGSVEIKQSGDMLIAKCSMAVSTWSKKEGKGTEWYDVAFFGRDAEYIQNYVNKGDVYSGIVERKTVKKDGKTFYNYTQAAYCGSFSNRKDHSQSSSDNYNAQPKEETAYPDEFADDDIPF